MNIFKAIIEDNISRVKKLLDSGIDVNIKNSAKETPLYTACRLRNIEIVKLLLEHPNIDVNIKDEHGDTPLFIACDYNRIEIVKLLLSHPDIDVNVNSGDYYESNPLGRACSYNRIEIVKLLLGHPSIDVNIQNKLGNTPLHEACESNNIEIVKLLLQHPNIDTDINYSVYTIKTKLSFISDEEEEYTTYLYSPKVRTLLKKHINYKQKSIINKILDTIED
jgi:ankyrin repeat protein